MRTCEKAHVSDVLLYGFAIIIIRMFLCTIEQFIYQYLICNNSQKFVKCPFLLSDGGWLWCGHRHGEVLQH